MEHGMPLQGCHDFPHYPQPGPFCACVREKKRDGAK